MKPQFPAANSQIVIMIYRFILGLFLVLASANACAAQFYKSCWPAGVFGDKEACFLRLKGEIQQGDAAVLRKILSVQKDVYAFGELRLDSPGGDVAEALKIAKVMQEWIGRATVDDDSICASACFLVWVASPMHGMAFGDQKPVPRIGLHRPYLSPEAYQTLSPAFLAKRQSEIMAQTRAFLEEQNLSRRLVDEMMRRPSNDVYWLTVKDLKEIKADSPYLEEMLVVECNFQANKVLPQNPDDVAMAKILIDADNFQRCTEDLIKRKRPKTISLK